MNKDCCCPPTTGPNACGCCEGVERLTPLPTANHPGLSALAYRIGTHASFLETMLARLSSSEERFKKLGELTARDENDFSIALLDAWATVADVLTFYQERIANEGYLRTATERRSLLELSRLVGYKPRPGVASSVYLAYTLDEHQEEEVVIPKGAKVQSIPGPGESPQTFETSEELKARSQWNDLRPRMTRPQTEESILEGDGANATIYIRGISNNLAPNDALLIDLGSDSPTFHRIQSVRSEPESDRTMVALQTKASATTVSDNTKPTKHDLLNQLSFRQSIQPKNAQHLPRELNVIFGGIRSVTDSDSSRNSDSPTSSTQTQTLAEQLASGEASYSSLKILNPLINQTLAVATKNAFVSEKNTIKVYSLRRKAGLFGHNMPLSSNARLSIGMAAGIKKTIPNGEYLALDSEYKEIMPGDWIAIDLGYGTPEVSSYKVKNVGTITLGGKIPYLQNPFRFFSTEPPITITTVGSEDESPSRAGGTSTKTLVRKSVGEPIRSRVTVLELNKSWRTTDDTSLIRTTTVYFQSEELELAEEPIQEPICSGQNQLIELDSHYEGLEPGKWIVVSGERELDGTSNVKSSELAMISSVLHTAKRQKKEITENSDGTETEKITFTSPEPGDKIRTFIKLATDLSYCFNRDTVHIHGNVVKATHGETRHEVLGNGDSAKALQSFTLKQSPLTHVPASTPTGAESTLKLYVNDIRWHETDSLAGAEPTARQFVTRTDDEDKTTLTCGDGKRGSRLPTGLENIKATYRSGIGKAGNVRSGQIAQPVTKPLGVKGVINPLPATGGADRETRDQIRKNAALAVKALDRLVSVQDYEDFTRLFAGIGKARAVELTNGRRPLVHITIAGADDIPIDKHSDLYRNLIAALRKFGDPYRSIEVAVRELMLIAVQARIRILPDYLWESVEAKVRAALLDAFSFERRELGQDVLLGEIIQTIQSAPGVAYVDVDKLRGIPETLDGQGLITPAEISARVSSPLGNGQTEPLPKLTVNQPRQEPNGRIRPAQLAFLSPDVPDTLILNPIT